MSREILVTGAAGFIGFHVALAFLKRGERVVGADNLSPYYDVSLKEARLGQLRSLPGFTFEKIDVGDRADLERLFSCNRFERVVHMAAQAGVRYSIDHPYAYLDSNLCGFLNILECCRHAKVPHLVYASSSSVYGLNAKKPFSVHDPVDHPISLYAATKKANELMAHTYSALYALPTTGLRFFTVYGPWGRPDMALFLFTKAILQGEQIDVYNDGRMRRDFTYIDDVVEGVVRVTDRIAQGDPSWNAIEPDPGTSIAPYRIYNIGNHQPVDVLDFIRAIEDVLGKKANIRFAPLQLGDVPETYADVSDLMRDVGFAPNTSVAEGIQKFIAWYRSYYRE